MNAEDVKIMKLVNPHNDSMNKLEVDGDKVQERTAE